MKRIYWFLLAAFVVLLQYSCGSEEDTYTEQKEHERDVVNAFVNRNVVVKLGDEVLFDMGKVLFLMD